MQVYKRHGANNGTGNNLKSISRFKDKKAKGLILQKIIEIPGYSIRTRRTNYISILSLYKYRKPQRLSLFHVNAEYSEP